MSDTINDPVNHPSHYKQGSQEAIVTIEETINGAPSANLAFLHGQTLKYLLRLWHKGKPKQDAEKARWYLNRLIDQMAEQEME